MTTTATRVALIALLVTCALGGQEAEARRSRKKARLRAMTFNIRYDFENDGENRWQHRVDAVAKAILLSESSVVCLQEDKRHQVEDLEQRLGAEFAFLGRGRNETGSGERCSILFKKDAFRAREHGDFWLSATPEVPGSNTWGDRYPRKATWALLEHKQSKQRLLVVNTHLPEGSEGRLRAQQIEVVYDFLAKSLGLSAEGKGKKSKDLPGVLMCGDYNDDQDSEIHAAMTEGSRPLRLRDAWEEAGQSSRGGGTFCGWRGMQTTSRIDWLLVGGNVRVLAARKLDEQVDGRWPSDHYPVMADIELR